ncbi:MMPL family transporter [Arsenicicoccus sp. oral taxon 190]|uniref:MMPL family transporter n=1 Tax=Arsenicicoccus sp. oral taxon 190 TaxID=1658671 RepID=UPI00067A017D|nr:MMPL family transporter [Arsenicicoccus sp. oral taxon 190]AKT50644.1 hypothetical protein ADJ73_03775 [Arsenicicoccus sp. oral taxon 190]
MATLLYRLGHFSARRPWAVVIIWLLLLGGVSGAAGLLSKPLSSQMTIKGAPFQRTLEKLKHDLPAAAGGTGTVVFTTDSGRFTPAQEAAVAQAVTTWKAMPAVRTALDPFATQRQLDDGRRKLADGEKQIADNAAKIDSGQAQIDDGKRKIAANTAKLEDGRSELTQALKQLADGEAKLEAGKRRVAEGQGELASGRRRLASGKADLAAGKRQVAQGRAKLEAGKRQIAAAQAKIDDGKAKLDAGQAKIDGGNAQLDAARQKVKAGEAQLADAKKKLAAGETALAAAEQQVAAAEQQRSQLQQALNDPTLPADRRTQLEAQIAQLTAAIDGGKARIAEQKPQLEEARKAIAAQEPQVKAGRQQVDDKTAALAQAQRTLDAKRAELAQGQRTLDAKAETIQGSEAQLSAAQRKVNGGQRQIDAAEAKLARGERAMAAAEEQIRVNEAKLADGRRQAEAGKIRISDGEQQLIAARDRIKTSEQQLVDGRAKLAQARKDLALGKRETALAEGLRFVSTDGTAALSQVSFKDEMQSVPPATRQQVLTVKDQLAQAGVQVAFGKELTDDVSSIMGPGEIIGLAVAAVVLLVTLGTLVAAGLPLLMALGGVGLGIGVTMAVTHFVTLNSVTPALGLMIGIAVGIDYALFIVNRHREQLKTGMSKVESIALATGTAGNAVTFAGMTVFIALAALAVTRMDFLAAMGFTAAGTVLAAVLINLSLLPAVLSLVGHRILPRRAWLAHGFDARGRSVQEEHPHDPERGDRGWGAMATRHPWVALAAGLVAIGILAVPAAGLRLGLPDGGSEPPGSSANRAYTTIADKFGPGANGPIIAVASLPEGLDAAQAKDRQLAVAEELATVPGLVRVMPIGLSQDRRTAAYQAVPDNGPADEGTVRTVEQIRDQAPAIAAKTGADVQITGQTVANIDISDQLAKALPLYLLIVVGLSLVLLLMVFRSVVVPLIATGGFLLSLAAAFGGVVAVYQHGTLGALFGVHHPSPVLSFLPILLIGVLFGLAMDYQMFIVSGMREAHVHGQDARLAVRTGFSHAARVVTAAAIIMISVFAGFIHAELTMIRPIGFGLALGVLIDAFLIRMTLTPAVMHLLGEKAWWMPRWLDKIVPDVDVEGVKLVDRVHGHPHA